MNHIHILSRGYIEDCMYVYFSNISPLLRKINNHWKTNDSLDLLNQPSCNEYYIMDEMIDSHSSVLGSNA